MASDNVLPIGANIECMICDHKWQEKYNPPISLKELYGKIGDCTKCGSMVMITAIFSEEDFGKPLAERHLKHIQKISENLTDEQQNWLDRKSPKIEIKKNNDAINPPKVPDRGYTEFIIDTTKKTVKQEDSLIRQIFYTAMSKDTADPTNLMVSAPTSEGKTWPVTETLKFFPKEDVLYIGKMSTMALVRQKGILMDSNNEPVKDKIKQLRRDISKTKNEDEKAELEDKLEAILDDVRSVIILTGKLIVFLEPPQSEVWELIKPILSHDKEEIDYPFVNNTAIEGIITKKVVVRGWPACIFCTAKDESNWPTWPEITSRFLITSPNMIPKKYEESNSLTAQRKSLPSFIQQQIIVSDRHVELAKQCVRYLISQLRNNHNEIWIPYGEILGEALKAEKGTDSRATKRIFSFLNVIPTVKADLRPRLTINGQGSWIIATLEDLNESLLITQNYAGITTNKMDFYNYDLFELYREKLTSHGQSEDGVTTNEMSQAHKLRTRRTLNSDAIRKSYLYELMNNGYVEEEFSVLDKRRKIYRPLIEPELEPEKIKKLRESVHSHNLLQPSVIILPRNCNEPRKNWLVLEVLAFLKCGIGPEDTQTIISLEDMAFYNSSGSKQTITQFVSEYEYTYSLLLYFRKPENHNFYTKSFKMSPYNSMAE
jgi:hypothetical protein